MNKFTIDWSELRSWLQLILLGVAAFAAISAAVAGTRAADSSARAADSAAESVRIAGAQLRPHLQLMVLAKADDEATFALENVGLGHAMDVRLSLADSVPGPYLDFEEARQYATARASFLDLGSLESGRRVSVSCAASSVRVESGIWTVIECVTDGLAPEESWRFVPRDGSASSDAGVLYTLTSEGLAIDGARYLSDSVTWQVNPHNERPVTDEMRLLLESDAKRSLPYWSGFSYGSK